MRKYFLHKLCFATILLQGACLPSLDRTILDVLTLTNLNNIFNGRGSNIQFRVVGLEGENFSIAFDPSTNFEFQENGSYTFPVNLQSGNRYNLTIRSAPRFPLQECTITPSEGTTGEQIEHLVECTTIGYPVRVNTRALANSQLVLSNNGETLSISGNGLSTFPSDVLINGTVNINIVSQPQNHFCNISPTTGTILNSEIVVEANCFSLISVSPSNNGILPPTQPIRLVFSDAISTSGIQEITPPPSTLETTGAPPQILLDQTNSPNDTIILQPSGDPWEIGVGRTVTFAFTSESGLTMPGGDVTLSYTVPSQIRYVSMSGLDTNTGLTPTTAFRNIQPALDSIATCPALDCVILVEEGSYPATFVPNDFITLVQGVSIQGGYVPGSGFNQRNTATRNTIIDMPVANTTCTDSTQAEPCRAILAPSGITTATILDSLRIISRDANFTVGLFASGGGSPRILNTTLQGGNLLTETTGITAGMRSVNSNFALENSTSRGGNCSVASNTSIGIVIGAGATSTPNISNSTGEGGVCDQNNSRSIGLQTTGTGTLNLNNVKNNTFRGGDSNATTSSNSSIGMESIANIGTTISGNTFIAGKAQTSYGIRNAQNLTLGSSTFPVTIRVPDGLKTGVGVLSQGGNVTVSFANFEFGTLGGDFGIIEQAGVWALGTGTLNVRDSSFSMGSITAIATQPANQIGIRSTTSGAGSEITRNRITMGRHLGGSNLSTFTGISWTGSSVARITNNIITGGEIPHRFYGVDSTAFGQATRIQFNTIRVATGNTVDSFAVRCSAGVNNLNIIQKNIFYYDLSSSGTCVYMGAPSALGGSIRNNNFFNCTNKVFTNSPPTNYTDICVAGSLGAFGTACNNADLYNLGAPEFTDNNADNPQLANPLSLPGNFSPTENTPCQVARSPLTVPDITIDILEEPRPNTSPPGNTMGAIQWNGACL